MDANQLDATCATLSEYHPTTALLLDDTPQWSCRSCQDNRLTVVNSASTAAFCQRWLIGPETTGACYWQPATKRDWLVLFQGLGVLTAGLQIRWGPQDWAISGAPLVLCQLLSPFSITIHQYKPLLTITPWWATEHDLGLAAITPWTSPSHPGVVQVGQIDMDIIPHRLAWD